MATPAESNFQIRVALMDSEPLIWRRVQLSGETTLEELHHVIQVVMDWENYHMHRFVASDRVYGVDEDFMPDPQTRLIVVALVVTGRPALRAACRAGA